MTDEEVQVEELQSNVPLAIITSASWLQIQLVIWLGFLS
jgi:hypothetical protein